MITFAEFEFSWEDGVKALLIGLGIFIFTYLIYPPIIKWLKKKRWVGYDIHKVDRPETAESGGIGLTFGLIVGLILIGIFFPQLWMEVIVFLITVIAAALIGLYDDQNRLSSMKKILLMVVAGIPIFIFNYFEIIDISSPAMPILGRLRALVWVYPVVIPVIIAITTNTVNMLEGYNGEGSGTTSISMIFIIIAAIIAQSVQGVVFGIVTLAVILAFYFYNKFPSKAFPGDIGTLVIGAAIGMVAVLGSLEVVMFIALLTQVFNSFYVIASVRGFKESHDIKKKDIWLAKDNVIHASDEDGAPMTLPRLILAKGPLSEPKLVHNFLMLAVISGFFSIVAVIVIEWSMHDGWHDVTWTWIYLSVIIIGYAFTVWKNKRIFGITMIMILLLSIGLLMVGFIDRYIVDYMTPDMNWFYGIVLGGVILFIWYYISVRYFWTMIDRMKKTPGYISTKQHQEEMKSMAESKDALKDSGVKRLQ